MIVGCDFDGTLVDDSRLKTLDKNYFNEINLPFYTDAILFLQSDKHKFKVISGRINGVKVIKKILKKNKLILPVITRKNGKINDKKKAELVNNSNVDIYVEDRPQHAKYITKPTFLLNHITKKSYKKDVKITTAINVSSWFEIEKWLNTNFIFSPGPVPTTETINVDFSHRSQKFQQLYNNLKSKFRQKFNIPNNFEILFINGSGTAALESVINSLPKMKYKVMSKGVFSDRMKEIIIRSGNNIQNNNYDIVFYTQFETSRSKYYNIYKPNKLHIVDAISGFGYYKWSLKFDVTITSSSKILGGLPVLGIIIINKKLLPLLNDNGYYLNLKRINDYDKHCFTPHTPMLPQFISLYNALDKSININENIKIFKKVLKQKIIKQFGDNGPVLSFKVEEKYYPYLISELLKYNIEVYVNPTYMKNQFQVSMFNYHNTDIYKWLAIVLNYVQKEVI